MRGGILLWMKALPFILLCLLLLSIFTSCDQNQAGAIAITLDSGALGKTAEVIDSVENQQIALPSGDAIWTTDEYSFSGWATARGGDVVYKAGAMFSSPSDVTLYAVWTENLKITYLPNGGTGESVTEYHKSGEKVRIKDSSFTRDGWGFKAWNTADDESGTSYAAGQELTLSENLTFYAIWSQNTVTLSYNANGGEGAIDSRAVVPGTEVTLSDGIGFSYTDYTLVSWCTTSDGTGTKYDLGSSLAITEDTVLYAVWKDAPTNLTYILNAEGSAYSVKALSTDISGAVVIPSTYKKIPVTAIEDKAFYECTFITSVIIPDSVTTVGKGVFYGCSNLESVRLPEGMETIASYEEVDEASTERSTCYYGFFQNCSKLKNITIPKSVKNIDNNAFYGCSLLSLVTFEGSSSLETIGEYAFRGCSSLKKISVPDSVTSLGGGCFTECPELEKATLGSGITLVDRSTFSYCTSLESVAIKGNVKSIEESAFFGCSSLIDINLSDTLETLGQGAFENCTSLASIQIPDSVTKLVDAAFRGCSELISIALGSKVQSIGTYAFSGCNKLASIYIDNIEGATGAPTGSRWSAPSSCIVYWTGNYSVSEDGVLTLKDRTAATGAIVIPDKVNGITVTAIGEMAFQNNTSLASVTLPSTVTEIGMSAFAGCTGLTCINGMGNVRTVGNEAFRQCSSLQSIDISSVTGSIGAHTLRECTSLTSITIPDSVTSLGLSAFYGCSNLTDVTLLEGLGSIDAYCFFGCSSLSSVSIPESVTSVAESVFTGCSSLTSITINNTGLTSDKNWEATNATYLCGNFKVDNEGYLYAANASEISGAITLPSKIGDREVKKIGYNAFYGKTRLQSVSIPESVSKIEYGAFQGCTELSEVTLPSGLEAINGNLFYECTSLESINIPSGLKTIDANAFYGCIGLKSIVFPDTLTKIGAQAFSGCTGLESISIPGNCTEIEHDAFQNCSGITSIYVDRTEESCASPWGASNATVIWASYFTVTDYGSLDVNASLDRSLLKGTVIIPSAVQSKEVTRISTYAFKDCTAMTSVKISNGVDDIGSSSFENCTSLIAVEIPDSVTSLGSEVFKECTSLSSISISANVSSVGRGVFSDCVSLREWPLSSKFKPENGVYAGWPYLTSCIIPDGTMSISYAAFENCTGLKEIVIPDSVTSIDPAAFRGCTVLAAINLPSSITKLDNDTFNGCSGLTSITIPSKVTSIGNDTFRGCSGLTSITIPDGVTTIGNNAFTGCSSLISIVIPESTTSLGCDVFSGCSSLESISIDKEYDSTLDSYNNRWGAPETCKITWKPSKVAYGSAVSSAGDIMELGTYPATAGIYAGTAVRWEALYVDTDNKRALMISEKVLEQRAFDPSSNSYSNSAIRDYLTSSQGDGFINTYGIDTSHMLYVDVTSSTEITSVGYGSDKLFLLSRDEVENDDYFAQAADRRAYNLDGSIGQWWIRSANGIYGCCIKPHDNEIGEDYGVRYEYGLRPAFWYTWE